MQNRKPGIPDKVIYEDVVEAKHYTYRFKVKESTGNFKCLSIEQASRGKGQDPKKEIVIYQGLARDFLYALQDAVGMMKEGSV